VSEKTGQGMNHLDEMTGLLYLERQLDRVRAQEVSAHAQDCAACRTLLRALERESRLLTRAMLEEEEALPARLAEFQERAKRSLQWIWAVAFGLAATGAYALYTGYIEPWQQQLDQAGFGSTNLLSLLVVQGAFWKGWQSMATLFEVIALLTLAGFGAMFFRRRIRRGSALALVLAGFCAVVGATLALPSAASATEFRKGQVTTVGKDETVKSDLFISGATARIDGTVDGDVFFFGQRMEVNGHVTGDVIAFGQAVQIRGQVDGNVRFFGNNVTVTGSVGKNMMVFNDFANVDSGGKVGGSVTAFAGSVGLDGRIGRDLLLFVSQATISGAIGGEIRAKGDSMTINSTAEIEGPVHFEGNKAPNVSPQAKLASPVEFKKIEHKPQYRESGYYVWRGIWTAALILFGLVLFALMPRFAQESVDSAERYGASLGLGVLVFFGVPIASVIACVTVVGLPLGITTFLLWLTALFIAQLVVAGLIGQWLLGRTSDIWPLIGRMAIGLLIVRLAGSIPHAGGWIRFGVLLWGMGAISLALYRRFQPVIAPGSSAGSYTPPLPPNTTVGGVQPA
jgi:cytoskeletal protein CcmA (bactofilin family)